MSLCGSTLRLEHEHSRSLGIAWYRDFGAPSRLQTSHVRATAIMVAKSRRAAEAGVEVDFDPTVKGQYPSIPGEVLYST